MYLQGNGRNNFSLCVWKLPQREMSWAGDL